MKLRILRIMFIIGIFIAYTLTAKLRFKWLFHYLMGSGDSMRMPTSLLKPEMPAIGRYSRRTRTLTGKGFIYHLNHSILYEGNGFYGRPEMFYIVGGMTLNVEFSGKDVEIIGNDVYDWHPDNKGEFFTSAMNTRVTKVMGRLFGNEYFPMTGYPMGSPGISNKLWMDLETVGAKPFTTHVEVSFKSHEWRKFARHARGSF